MSTVTTGGTFCGSYGCRLSGPLVGLRWIIGDHRWNAIGCQPGTTQETGQGPVNLSVS